MDKELKIKITFGLIGLVALAAFLNTAFDRILPQSPEHAHMQSQFTLPTPLPTPTSIGDQSLLPQPVITSRSVNRAALDEVKQQASPPLRKVYNPNTGEHVPLLLPQSSTPGNATLPVPPELKALPTKATSLTEEKGGRWVRSQTTGETFWCAACDPVTYPSVAVPVQESELSRVAREMGASIRQSPDGKLYATLPTGQTWNATGQRGTHAFSDHRQIIAEMTQGIARASQSILEPSAIVQTPATRVSAPKAFDLSLYLDDSPRSRTIRAWFESDKDLAYIRSQCNFQIYTPGNPLYQARLSNVISTDNFPAVLLTYADGAHIHAAAENMNPSTAPQLAKDLYYFATLASDGRKQEANAIGAMGQSGALKTSGYNWNKDIHPAMTLMMAPGQNAEQCIDKDHDGVCDEPIRSGFLEAARANAEKSAVAWVSPTDMLVVGLVCIAGYLVYQYLRRD